MTADRRPFRPAVIAAGWGLVVVAAVGETTGGFAALLGDIGGFVLLVVGFWGLALAALGASIDAAPVVLDRRLVGFSIAQRQLLRYAGIALAVGIPVGVVVSVVLGGFIGAALTLTAVLVGILLLSVTIGRSVRHAIELRYHRTDEGG